MGRVAAGLLASLLAAGCAGAPPASPAPPAGPAPPAAPARCAWDAKPPPQASSGPGYRYHVAAGPGAEELCVQVDLPPGPAASAWAPDP
jgi:hypothetical protein